MLKLREFQVSCRRGSFRQLISGWLERVPFLKHSCLTQLAHLTLQEVLPADFVDQLNLCFKKINVLFGIVQDVFEQITRHKIQHGFAVRNTCLDGGLSPYFRLQITCQRLGHVLPNQQLAYALQIRQAVELEDAVHQLIGMLHLADGFFVLFLRELVQAPMLILR